MKTKYAITNIFPRTPWKFLRTPQELREPM